MTTLELLPAFIKLLEEETNERIKKQYPILHENAIKNGRRGDVHVEYETGGRFWKIIRRQSSGGSVAYFVERDTGIIFGAKSYKAYNPVHQYGTLETIHEWDWSDYYAKHKQGKSSMVPKAERK